MIIEMLFVLVILFGAISNSASMLTIGVIFLFAFTIFSSKKEKSIVEITKPIGKSALDTLDRININAPEGFVDDMLKDFGKATAGMIKGRNPDLSAKTVLKSTYKTLDNTTKIFKS